MWVCSKSPYKCRFICNLPLLPHLSTQNSVAINSTGKPLYVSRQVSRHDPKLEHITNYVPNYETIFVHLLWGRQKPDDEGYGCGWNPAVSLVRGNQSAYYLFSQMTKHSFLCCYHSHRRVVTKTKTYKCIIPTGRNRETKTHAYESSFCCSVAVVSVGCFSGSSSP